MKRLYPYLFFLFLCLSAQAQEFKVYQFPADKVPAIDGNTHDWDCVPADYKITEAALKEDEGKHAQPDTTPRGSSLNVYSVSPRRTPKSFGPMPTANSSTTIPFFFATIKCPNSWNMTMMPNTRSATISFNLPPAFYITIGPLFSLKYIFKRRMINPLMGCHTL